MCVSLEKKIWFYCVYVCVCDCDCVGVRALFFKILHLCIRMQNKVCACARYHQTISMKGEFVLHYYYYYYYYSFFIKLKTFKCINARIHFKKQTILFTHFVHGFKQIHTQY